ncbi:hypothetical protein NX801_27095 [Streptomyces sp. LP05-1]|uniref:Uncharacterized protein n=1 Tax=Streptomyces pyxinae TaxID=2970734 RepID=A0ABT2CP78_9ACTN|nr:hypothetical protein [Streptomyces sp. LP05-1]MCS0639243.1 hypothetical protein [Streptomyces sp. LP05-1]
MSVLLSVPATWGGGTGPGNGVDLAQNCLAQGWVQACESGAHVALGLFGMVALKGQAEGASSGLIEAVLAETPPGVDVAGTDPRTKPSGEILNVFRSHGVQDPEEGQEAVRMGRKGNAFEDAGSGGARDQLVGPVLDGA